MGNVELSKVYQISLLQDISKPFICKYASCGYLSHPQLFIASDNKDAVWGKNRHGPYPHGGYNLVGKVDIYHTITQMKYKMKYLFGEGHSAIKHVQEISICSRKVRER